MKATRSPTTDRARRGIKGPEAARQRSLARTLAALPNQLPRAPPEGALRQSPRLQRAAGQRRTTARLTRAAARTPIERRTRAGHRTVPILVRQVVFVARTPLLRWVAARQSPLTRGARAVVARRALAASRALEARLIRRSPRPWAALKTRAVAAPEAPR